MDPITHTCSGILLGQGLRPLTAARRTTLLVAGLAAFAPDFDSGLIHLCGDMIALWPLRILWPFSDHGFVLKWTSDFDYVVLAVVVVATGLSETDGFQHRAPWIITGAFLLLVAYFLLIPGWGAA